MASPLPPKPAGRLFVAAAIPAGVRTALRHTVAAVAPDGLRYVPEKRWHLTILFIGPGDAMAVATALAGTLEQPFMPTVTLTHIGPGKAPGQLWVYAQLTPLLTQLRAAVISRCAAAAVPIAPTASVFVPHIHLANVSAAVRLMSTVPLAISFSLSELELYASRPAGGETAYSPQARLHLRA